MKKTLMLIVIFIASYTAVYASEVEDVIMEYVDIYSKPLEEAATGLDMPNLDVSGLLKDAAFGQLEMSPRGIWNGFLGLFCKEVYLTIKIMVIILVLTVLSSLLSNLGNNFKSSDASQIAFFAVYILIAGVGFSAFYTVILDAQSVLDSLVAIMRTTVMMAVAALAGGGGIVSASTMQPAVIISIEIMIAMIRNVFIPFLMLAVAVGIVGNLSDKFNMRNLSDVLKKVIRWGLGILMTIFVGVISIQSISAAAFDGISVKVAKYAVGNFIPIIGGILSETVETVMGCSAVMKNAIGVAGMIIIVLIAVVPIVKLMAHIAIFKLCGAVMQPIADDRTIRVVSEFGEALTTMFIMLLVVTVMFLIIISIIINTGNNIMVMRG